MGSYLLVHDCRPPAVLGSAVLCRRLTERGDTVEVYFDEDVTGRSESFWAAGVANLLGRSGEDVTLILFGITFVHNKYDFCLRQIANLRNHYQELMIWSHRFPDGFQRSGIKTLIPPDDLIFNPPGNQFLSQVGEKLDPYDKQLLSASLLAAKALPEAKTEAQRVAHSVAQDLFENAVATWARLLEGSYTPKTGDGDNPLLNEITVISEPWRTERVVQVSLADGDNRLLVPMLEALCDSKQYPDETVCICWVGTHRVVLYRNDRKRHLPSLRWLLENRYQHLVPTSMRGNHYGPQDAVFLPTIEPREVLSTPLQHLASELARAKSGGRMLTAAMARDVASVGAQILAGVDLRSHYTGNQQLIRIVEEDMYVLLHESSRSGERRATLVVPLEANGSEATAFLYRDSGYNLLKVEKTLEGALLGMRSRVLRWLHPDDDLASLVHLPNRVRVDVRPLACDDDFSGFVQATHAALADDLVTSVEAGLGGVREDSLIGGFLSALGMRHLVCYNESETIGPSVAHAVVLLSTARVAHNDQNLPVLDLFAGSGIANRLLSRSRFAAVSVDKYVSQTAVIDDAKEKLHAPTQTSWLRADVREVLDARSPILEGRFSVIGLDPPHAELMDLLFGDASGENLIRSCCKRAPLIVLYQGHSSQSGRLDLLVDGLRRAGYIYCSVIQAEEELVLVAGNEGSAKDDASFRGVVDSIINAASTIMYELSLPAIEVKLFSRPTDEWA